MSDESASRIHVLYVDADRDAAEDPVESIDRHDARFDIVPVTSASDGIARLAEHGYDCVVSGFDLPDQNGITFLQAVREDHPDLPFILFARDGSEEIASKAISSGVTDYLQKDPGTSHYEVLANRISNAVSQFHTQQELDRSQDLFDHTEQLADVGGWEADVETGEQRWTDGTYAIHGIDPDSDFNPTVDGGVDFYHPDDQDEISRLVDRCKEHGEPYDVELRLLTADDRLRWVRATGEPVRNDGEIVTIRGAIRDITEQKEREQEIARLNQLHQTILSNIRETVVVTDDDGQFTYVCPNVHFVFGYDAEDVRDFGTVEALFGERLIESDGLGTDGEVTNIETTITDSDGGVHTVLMTVRQVDIEDGTRLYSVRDITERKEWERELRQRKRQLQAVLDSVEATIWIRNLDNRFELVNQNFRNLFGFADDTDIVGKHPSDLFSEETAAQFQNNDRKVIQTGESAEIEEEVATDQGERIYLTRITPLFDDDGEVVGTCGVASDITTQKTRERALKEQNERLDQFASSLRHELRNPLNILDGYLDVARETGRTDAFESCQTAVDQMQRLLEQTLIVLKGGDTALDKDPVELEAVCEACWKGMPETGARLETDTTRELIADEDRLKQLLGNLFRNAAEHGGPAVTVRVGDLETGFYVEDDGPGIPQDVRETVFEEGYSTSEAGSGLGLAVVETVAAAHGWDVRITDGPMEGARFEITDANRP